MSGRPVGISVPAPRGSQRSEEHGVPDRVHPDPVAEQRPRPAGATGRSPAPRSAACPRGRCGSGAVVRPSATTCPRPTGPGDAQDRYRAGPATPGASVRRRPPVRDPGRQRGFVTAGQPVRIRLTSSGQVDIAVGDDRVDHARSCRAVGRPRGWKIVTLVTPVVGSRPGR